MIPCCQAEVSKSLRSEKSDQLKYTLSELWRHPIHTREFGSHLTNVLRCLLLEGMGYKVTVTELVGWEHSMKNELSDATFSSQSILDAIDKEPIQIQFNKDKKLSDVIAISNFDWMSWPVAASFIAVLFVGAMITMNPLHTKTSNAVEIAEDIPNEYIEAHQMLAPTNVAFYVDTQAK